MIVFSDTLTSPHVHLPGQRWPPVSQRRDVLRVARPQGARALACIPVGALGIYCLRYLATQA